MIVQKLKGEHVSVSVQSRDAVKAASPMAPAPVRLRLSNA